MYCTTMHQNCSRRKEQHIYNLCTFGSSWKSPIFFFLSWQESLTSGASLESNEKKWRKDFYTDNCKICYSLLLMPKNMAASPQSSTSWWFSLAIFFLKHSSRKKKKKRKSSWLLSEYVFFKYTYKFSLKH